MATFIALIRGINVGGNNSLPMKELRALLEKLGYEEVKTYIQSGNAVFRAPGTAKSVGGAISDAIGKKFKFRPSVYVISKKDFDKVIAQCPYEPADGAGKTVHMFFCVDGPPEKADLDGLKSIAAPNEQFTLKGNVFYLLAPDGIGRSKLVEKLGRYIKAEMTARNLNSMLAIAGLADEIS